MMTLREFSINDAPTILGWIKDKTAFRKWSADRYSNYPATPDDMAAQYTADNIYPLTADDENVKVIGHIMIRIPDPLTPSTVRLGFVIVDNALRGKRYGQELICKTIEYAKQQLGATKFTLGVFQNNPSAFHCYEAAGFKTTEKKENLIDGEIWECVEMARED